MVESRQTEEYRQRFADLSDRQARARLNTRIRRLSLGNPGDVKPVGHDVSEMRVDYGPGYRIYFIQQDPSLAVLLAGGVKQTQDRDIKVALDLAQGL